MWRCWKKNCNFVGEMDTPCPKHKTTLYEYDGELEEIMITMTDT